MKNLKFETVQQNIVTSFLGGDFDVDGLLTAADISALSDAIRTESNDTQYDLNTDGLIDNLDRDVWVHDLKNTFYGDANFDGQFDSADLVSLFKNGQYEDGVAANSIWPTGDWNGDAEFDSGDLVMAFKDGGYEMGPRNAVSSVPEPSSTMLILLGMTTLWRIRRR